MSTYNVRYELDEAGWWVAHVQGVPGCHTQGHTIDEARERIFEALQLCVDDPDPQFVETTEVALTSADTNNVSVRRSSRRVLLDVTSSAGNNVVSPHRASYSVGFPGRPELDQHVGLDRVATSAV